MCFVFCRLYPFSPSVTTAVFGSYLSSLLTNTCIKDVGLPYHFVGLKKKTIVVLIVFNPLWIRQAIKNLFGPKNYAAVVYLFGTPSTPRPWGEQPSSVILNLVTYRV